MAQENPIKQPKDESFCAPGITDLASLTDGRKTGDTKTRYNFWEWLQIIFELIYLSTFLAVGLLSLLVIARMLIFPQFNFLPEFMGVYPENKKIIVWLSVGLGGLCGGCTGALKWLYHSVAKQRWHRDRIVWRIIVPLNSAVLSTFTGLMIYSGVIPLLNETSLANPSAGAAFGFFLGLFSDNLLACLQNFAHSVFGTIDNKKADNVETPKEN